jgi:hypothetical protein
MLSIPVLISLTATFCGCFFLLYREIKTLEDCHREDFKQQAERIDNQALRSDKLYEMFIQLLKERDDKRTK